MGILSGLEPAGVLNIFEELCQIPHGSGNTRAISEYCVAFARARGLEARRDESGNVIIYQGASAGYENAAPVIVQGHLDMVCERAPGCRVDLHREGLRLATDGDVVWAEGTTLGADDGIAVAMALALLDAGDLPHPPLEVLLTVDEEIGMLGAAALDFTPLKGRMLLNIDSEVEGVFTVSCAGGAVARCALPVRREGCGWPALELEITGLTGGHSGVEIDKNRANANQLMGRVLCAAAAACALRVQTVEGGLKDNAIPTSCRAVVRAQEPDAVERAAQELRADFAREYARTDPGLELRSRRIDPHKEEPLDARSTQAAICLLVCAPNGVQRMSAEIEGLVQTSLNLGVLQTQRERIEASFCIRSSVASEKEMVKQRLGCLMAQLGGEVEIFGDYPAWEYRADSPLRARMVEVFREQYGREPRIEAIHAGVECGLFCGKAPGLDCVSFGPDLTEIHTPRERLHLASLRRVWAFLIEVLRRLR